LSRPRVRSGGRALVVALLVLAGVLGLLHTFLSNYNETPGPGASVSSVHVEPPPLASDASVPRAPLPPWTTRPFGPPELRILVRDELDRPIPGAHAQARWPAGSRPDVMVIELGGQATSQTEAVTGPLGRMETWGLPDGPVVVSAWADGFVRSDEQATRVVRGVTTEVRIELSPGVALEGQVLGEDGQRVAHAQVSMSELTAGRPVSSLRHLESGSAETDSTGRFRLASARPGQYRIVARRQDAVGQLPLVVPSSSVTIVLHEKKHRRGAIEGRVVVQEGGRAPTCRVSADRIGEFIDGPGVDSQGGTFSFLLEKGRYAVRAVCNLPQPGSVAVAEASVDEGRTTHIELVPEPGVDWAGHVLDESGAPVQQASVRVSLLGVEEPKTIVHGFAFGVSDERGAFVLHAVAASTYRVEAWLGTRIVETTSSPGGGPLVLRLPGEPRVSGVVVGPDGVPVRRYRLNGRAVQDQEGKFSFILFEDVREVRIVAVGGTAVVPIPSGSGGKDLGVIALTPELVASGRVIDAQSGAPISNVLLEPGFEPIANMVGFEHYNGGDDVAGSTRTDALGRFHYPHASQVPVLVTHPGHMRIEQVLQEGENVVRLAGGAVLEGRVRDEMGPTCVTAMGETMKEVTSMTDPGGGFRLEGLDRGTWSVSAGCREDGERVQVSIDRPGHYQVIVPPPGD